MNNSRYIELEGASNFREIGGLETTGGSKFKQGILYRSDELYRLTKNDLEQLRTLNLKTICDLRTPFERKSKPDSLIENDLLKVVNIPFFHQKQNITPWQFMEFLFINSNKLNFKKFMIDHYLNNAFELSYEVGKVVKLISDRKNLPAVIHCAAGKDRTGLISALIQLFAGVPRKIVLNEYLLTNIYNIKRIARTEKIIRRISFFRASSERIRPMLEVRAEYLDTVLDEILMRFKTMENYYIKACGVEEHSLQNLKSILLES